MDKELRKEYFEKAFKLHNNGYLQEAKNFYQKILTENPEDCEILNLVGICELQQQNFEVAEQYVTKAIKIKPNRYFFETLSKIYSEQNAIDKEIEVLRKEEELFGLNFDLSFRFGFVYKKTLNYNAAEIYYKKAIELNPKSTDTYMNLATIYLLLNNPEDAKTCYQKCIEINPDNIEAKYFLSLCYFRLKQYENGLPYFENRLCRETAIQTEKYTYPNLLNDDNLWKGEDISDKILYTYYEAGYGDMLMFARYIPQLAQKCKKLVIKPQTPLCQLFRENFPDVEIMDYFYPEQDFAFDKHIPFLSVPYVLGLKTEDMFVHRDKYLSADNEKAKHYKKEFFNNNKFKIGIKWQGNTYYETDRVIDTDAFAPLFNLPETQIYSAQTFEGSEEFDKLSAKYNIIDLSQSFKDFSYTAAALENLDLIICSDTSLAHLAGAMNKKCFVLLPYNSNWRWHTDLSTCDWYKSVTLFRAENGESWTSLMNRVVEKVNQENSDIFSTNSCIE